MINKKAVLAMFGCFNPPTNGHINLLSIARDKLEENDYDVVKGLFIPTHGGYALKQGLASAEQRVEMCRLASQSYDDWMGVEDFETKQPSWVRVVVTLEHLQSKYPDCRIFIACGVDFVQKWAQPCWEEADCLKILKDFGVCMAPRTETLEGIVDEVSYLQGENRLDNVYMLETNIMAAVCSTYVRDQIRGGKNAAGLLTPSVEKYVRENKLYVSNGVKNNVLCNASNLQS